MRFWVLLLLISTFRKIHKDFSKAKEVNPQMKSHSLSLPAIHNTKSHALVPDVFRNKILHIRRRRRKVDDIISKECNISRFNPE